MSNNQKNRSKCNPACRIKEKFHVHLQQAASVVWWLAFWPLVLKIADLLPAEAVGLFGRKSPQHAFLQKGIKAVCPILQICGMSKNPIIYRGSRKLRAKLFRHFSPASVPH
jgi:hypothetical protein